MVEPLICWHCRSVVRTQEEHVSFCWGQNPEAVWNWSFDTRSEELRLTKSERREAVRLLGVVAADRAEDDGLDGIGMLLTWHSGYWQRRLAKHLVLRTATNHAFGLDIEGMEPEDLEFDHPERAVAVVRAAQWVESELDDLLDSLDDEAIRMFAGAVVRAAQSELDDRLEELRALDARS